MHSHIFALIVLTGVCMNAVSAAPQFVPIAAVRPRVITNEIPGEVSND